jgi:hypothetical protein
VSRPQPATLPHAPATTDYPTSVPASTNYDTTCPYFNGQRFHVPPASTNNATTTPPPPPPCKSCRSNRQWPKKLSETEYTTLNFCDCSLSVNYSNSEPGRPEYIGELLQLGRFVRFCFHVRHYSWALHLLPFAVLFRRPRTSCLPSAARTRAGHPQLPI